MNSVKHLYCEQDAASSALHTRSGMGRDLAYLWSRLAAHRARMLIVLACLAVASATEPALVVVIKYTIDWGKIAVPAWLVYPLLPSAIPLLFVVRGLMSGLAAMLMGGVCADVVTLLQRDGHRQALNFKEASTARVGKRVYLLTFEIKQCADLLERIATKLIRHVLSLVALYASLFLLNAKLTLYATLALPLVGAVCWMAFGRLKRLTVQQIQLHEDLTDLITERSRKSTVVKLQRSVDVELKQFLHATLALRVCGLRLYSVIALIAPLTQVFVVTLMAIIVFGIARAAGAGAMTKGDAVAYVTNLILILAPLKNLAELNGPLLRSMLGLQAVLDVAERPPAAPVREDAQPPVQGRIDIKKLTWRYPGQVPAALRDVNVAIAPGEMVAIVGPSGAGKSSLLHILRSETVLPEGELSIDGWPRHRWSSLGLYRQIAFVAQQPQLLNRSVSENVAYGDPNPDRTRVWEALADAQLDHAIRAMPLGLDTDIGRDGQRLSGGQARLLVMARAFYSKAPIILLDEPTASLDARTEENFLAALNKLRQNRTLLVITHSAAVAAGADRVLFMLDGQVANTGSHAELSRSDPRYVRIFSGPPSRPVTATADVP